MPLSTKQVLRKLKEWWMKFAAMLGWINTRVILTIVYFILFGLIALIVRILRKDLLRKRRSASASYWKPKEKIVHSIDAAKHQF